MSWSVRDRWGNEIILSDERWRHIIDGHWELEGLVDQVLDTLRLGTRKQSSVNSSQYRYTRRFSDLAHGYTHVVVIVRMGPNPFVITAYPKRVR